MDPGQVAWAALRTAATRCACLSQYPLQLSCADVSLGPGSSSVARKLSLGTELGPEGPMHLASGPDQLANPLSYAGAISGFYFTK